MGALDEGGNRRGEGAVFGVNLGRPIVTNGDFATWLFPNYFGQRHGVRLAAETVRSKLTAGRKIHSFRRCYDIFGHFLDLAINVPPLSTLVFAVA